MLTLSQPRAGDVRALANAVLLGSVTGLAIGGAYLLGGSARLSTAHLLTSGAPAMQVSLRGGREVYLPKSASASRPLAAVAAPKGWAALRARFGLDAAPASPFRLAAAQDADLTCLTQVVYYEARGESAAGQAAVAQVVLNRVRHPAFPKTICGVAHQRSEAGCQFTFACRSPVAEPISGGAWRRSRRVAYDALHGAVMPTVGEATHFQTARSSPFAGLLKVAQIGAHVFYRFSGRGGAAGMFHQTPAPSRAPEIATAPPALSPQPVQLASLSTSPAALPVAPGANASSAPPPVALAPRQTSTPIAPVKVDPPVIKPAAKVAPPPAAATPIAIAQS